MDALVPFAAGESLLRVRSWDFEVWPGRRRCADNGHGGSAALVKEGRAEAIDLVAALREELRTW